MIEAIGEAKALVDGIPRESTADPQTAYGVAVVYCLAGERAATLRYARRAVEGGIRRRWFGGSTWRALAGDPELDRLLATGYSDTPGGRREEYREGPGSRPTKAAGTH